MTLRGHVKNGVVVLDIPAILPEGIAVEVSVVAGADKAEATIAVASSLLDRLKPFAGAMHDLPADAATNLKRDLYGYPEK